MSQQCSQSEQREHEETIAKLRMYNAKLFNTVAKKQREIEELRNQMRNMEPSVMATALSNAQATSITPACGSLSTLPSHIRITSEKDLKQQRVVALEKAIGVLTVSNTELVKKLTQLQSTVEEQRDFIDKLGTLNAEMKASISELTGQIKVMQMSDGELRDMILYSQRSLAEHHELIINALNAPSISSSVSTTTVPSTPSTSVNNSPKSAAPIKSFIISDETSGTWSSNSTVTATSTDPFFHETAGVSSSLLSPTAISEEQRDALSKELYIAADEGNVHRICQLVANGANFEYKDEILGITALHNAAWHGHVNALKTLIRLGAPLEAEDNFRATPLHIAAYNDREDCVKALLLAGAKVDARDMDGSTPLHEAAERESGTIVHTLIAAGADREAKDNSGKIPKDYAKSDNLRDLL